MNAFDPIDPPPSRRTRPGRLALLLVLAPLVLAAFWAGSAVAPGLDAPATPRRSEPAPDRWSATAAEPARDGSPRRSSAATEADMSSLWSVEQATVDLFKTASPSVVYITTLQNSRNRFSGRVYQTQAGAGSGFVWDR